MSGTKFDKIQKLVSELNDKRRKKESKRVEQENLLNTLLLVLAVVLVFLGLFSRWAVVPKATSEFLVCAPLKYNPVTKSCS